MPKRRKKIKLKKKNIAIFIIIVILIIIGIVILVNTLLNKKDLGTILTNDYSKYYSEIVKIKNDTSLYTLKGNNYEESGKIYKDTIVKLDELTDKKNQYFKISDLDNEYYIKYSDIEAVDNYYQEDNRYKKYIVFNKNIITDETTTFYLDDYPLYELNKSFNLPIIINDEEEEKYYVEYNNMLLYVKQDDVVEIKNNQNTEEINTTGIPVLNYHFVYKPDEETCDQEICHPEEQFRQHMSYIKESGYFTPTMAELDMYMDGKLQLPQSVIITLDDGRNINLATKIIEEYELNATAFIVTSRYNVEEDFIKSDYVELQSHSHALHDAGTCPPGHGQGGGLTCKSDEEVLNDLKTSIEQLKGAIAFCYPFYEYNDNSIKILKEAGFKLAFAGEYANGKTKAEVGGDKYQIPRWVIVTYTTMDLFKDYVDGKL